MKKKFRYSFNMKKNPKNSVKLYATKLFFIFSFVLLLPNGTIFAKEKTKDNEINSSTKTSDEKKADIVPEKRVLTLDEAIKLALENNPDLKKNRLSLEDAKRRNINMWNKFLPSLSASGSLTDAHDFEGSSNWSWGASASATLSFTFALPSSMQLLNLNYQQALISYKSLEAQTKANVSTSFYSLIAEQKNLEILRDSQKLAKQVYEQTERNYRSGLSSELDLLKAQYSYSSIEPQIQQAISTFLSNFDSFALILGLDSIQNIELEGELESPKINLPNPKEVVETYLERRSDVILADIAVKQAQVSKISTISSSMLPSLNFSERVNFSEDAVAKANGATSAGDLLSTNGSFSVSVTLPLSGLIPGSSDFLNVQTQTDSIRSAQISAEETRKSAKNDILTKYSNISRLWNALEVAKMNENISQRSYELSQEGYNAGLVSQTDLESARQQYVSSQQTVLQSQISYLSALYASSQAINLSMEEFYEKFGESVTDKSVTGESATNANTEDTISSDGGTL